MGRPRIHPPKVRKMSKDEANVGELRTGTIQGLAKDKFFNLGYATYKAGNWHKDYDTWSINAQWRYERGRHYAAAGGPPIKYESDKRVLRRDALYFIGNMLGQRAMI